MIHEKASKIKNDRINYWKLFVDGASRNNPGLAGAGIFLLQDNQPVEKKGFFIGVKTNNQAEYLALLLGLFYLKKYARTQDVALVISDSELLVKQLRGEYKVKKQELKDLYAVAKELIEGLKVDFAHVLREDNKVADKMANIGIDQKMKVPQDFLDILNQHAIFL